MKTKIKSAIIASILLFTSNQINAQCTVTIETPTTAVDCGECFTLQAIGSAEETLMYEDFNNSALGPGWVSNQTVMFNNPCGAPPDGTPSAWFGNQQSFPRYLETTDYDVTCGGNLCFEMKYATQGGPGSCEGPDLPNEGVKVQYSINGGATWVNIFDHVVLNGGYDPIQTTWQEYCHAIPAAAQTTSTRFRWIQEVATSAIYDHWGIDDIAITGQLCNSYYYDWSANGISNQSDTTDCLTAGSQNYIVLYTDGLTDTCSATITMTSTLFPNLDPDTLICGLTDLELNTNPTGGSGNYTYVWNTGETTSEIEVSTTGEYWVEITDLNFPDCKVTDTSFIEIYPSPDVNFSAFPLCQGTPTQFTDLTELPPGTDVTNWSWNFNNQGATSTLQNPSHQFSGVSSYNVTLSVVTEDGCTGDTTIQIVISPSAFANFSVEDPCENQETQFNDQSLGDYVNLDWDFGDNSGSSEDTNPTYIYNNSGTYNVTLVISDSSGLCRDTVIQQVQVFTAPNIDFEANPTIGQPPLPVNFLNTSSGASNYSWDFDNGNFANTNNNTVFQEFNNVGTYDVELTGVSPEGCIGSKVVTIIVEFPDIELEIPNVFTPNGDNVNDEFFINYKNNALGSVTSFEFVVFNRWGNIINTFNDPLFKWDGKTSNGTTVTNGTYFYKLTIETTKGSTVEEHGFMQVVIDN